MFVLEFKVEAKLKQYQAIDDAIRTAQFIRNKCLKYWMDNKGVNKYDLSAYCRVLSHDFKFASQLNSQARQASAERAWSSISRFFDNCKQKVIGKKGYPQFKKFSRSVEYKTTGWKLLNPKTIHFSDKKEIGTLKLKGTWDLGYFQQSDIKRVRLIKRADGYYCQFVLSCEVKEDVKPSGKCIGIDVGLASFYTDHEGNKVDNPKFLKKSEKRLKRLQRRLSKKKKGSKNRQKARQRLAKAHLKISRQRKDFAVKLARCVVRFLDVIAQVDLRIKNLVKNHCLAKSINDAAWYQFREWLEYFGVKFGKITIAVPPNYTSQNCSNCGEVVKKSLSTRTHQCKCGCVLDRDENAAINILKKGLSTVGHTGTFGLDPMNAWGENTSTFSEVILSKQVISWNQESPSL
ncbi:MULTISPECIES: RNA-guided endonuclease InsQ/TnpB family protein [Microcystis]|jgi:putative transposase|uniref:Transposase, IS605 OrfB family protein n=3 Tax=Microcystis TaxID=1125 RepID=A0A6H9GW25_MICAE|nr:MULTISPECIES: RNA-guided endonuclease TnpB family protein [Microcystis]MCA2901243.1 transposase [Microcystis sp. M035S1]NCR78427.1 IS200/IS605 family element transposase accessory protein TnpB [Microcystis aeruginosa K13-10]NCR83125.1 IS200/IS605 family element transposase accessory protein TnpB [Microcystis aeruginosa K13-05]KXS93137.1 transposase [Microcystis aeruginosa NIES-88]MCA2721994.1 transposase [Microcystis sp. M176S2]